MGPLVIWLFPPHLRVVVVDEYEEEDEADESADECEQSEEEPLGLKFIWF